MEPYQVQCPHCFQPALMKIKNAGPYVSCEMLGGCGAIVTRPKGWTVEQWNARYPSIDAKPEASPSTEGEPPEARSFIDEIWES